jgi:Flp pilus assembly protein CpaB
MTIDYRTRNIVIAAALAAAAVLLTVIYVNSARKHDTALKQSVTVYVPSSNYSVGTAGTKIIGNMKAETIARAAMAPHAVTSPDQIRNLYLAEPVYSGEQLSLLRFAPPSQQGIRSQLKGTQRAVQLPGDTNQLLVGTLVPGDRVDVVVNLKNPSNTNDVRSFVALRDLRVLQTQDGKAGAKITKSTDQTDAVILALTDEQDQRLNYVLNNNSATVGWYLQLRPVKKPGDSITPPATFSTVVAGAK